MAKRKIDGVLLLDKPFGISSNNALQKARWLLQAEKGGHTGVLDPFATGLLPLCFGEATKFAQRMLEADKGYRATIKLGQVSTTLDGEGEITKSGDAPQDEAVIRAAVMAFVGPVTQTPPMYSALKFKGKALYEYAREGVEIERQSRQITIYNIDIVSVDGDVVVIDVSCSKGTYIRVLAQDIGLALGCGAYLTGLRRTRTAGFLLENAIDLDAFNLVPEEARDGYLLPADCLLLDVPALFFDAGEFEKIRHGMTVERMGLVPGEYRLYAEGKTRDNARFIGLGEVAAAAENPQAWLRPKRLLSGL
ncbi:MAG: tRNA pseudouridine(55) synthase TruB [Iodobacter sp.]|jgi:tRNA pseudouridine55 synthase